jgi:hypothetical protein
MERLYNPDLMSKKEIKDTFVARQELVDEIVSLIKHQPKGAGVQHAVIIAPRGMVKTTVLLMVRFAIQDGELADSWQAVQFPEESYNIYDLADFWIKILDHLSEATGDAEIRHRIANLEQDYPNNDDLQEAALALLKDWRRKHKKRLVVLVDNFDMILEQINDERDNARLRDVLMNDGTMMLIGGATTFFHEARAYDQPLYNFFKIYDLPNLKFEQMQDLLRRRASIDKRTDFEETLIANKSRLRVLEHFTGGNPRLVLMLYRVITQSNISEVKLGLEKLLDEVTPYYKAKVESLPPQQRKILDHIARVSSQTNEGLTPTEIASATRMTPNQASAQLKRLVENGYVQAANLRGRSSYYTLSERLYAIWHQMRFGRNARERMSWLVSILKALYDVEEMGTQGELLKTRFREHLIAGRLHEARDTLEHHHYLVEAMEGLPVHIEALEGVFRSYLDIGATEFQSGQMVEALQHFEKALELSPNSAEILNNCALTLFEMGRYKEAITKFDQVIEIKPDTPYVWFNRGVALIRLSRHEEAVESFKHALTTDPTNPYALQNLGVSLSKSGKIEEALESLKRAVDIKPDYAIAWYNLGNTLGRLDRTEEAIASYDRALQVEPEYTPALHNRSLEYLVKFADHISKNEIDLAREAWNNSNISARSINDKRWIEFAAEGILMAALFKSSDLALQLIQESGLEEQFFSLSRAVEYIQTGDEALLEKLSPEVRGIVEKVIARLRQSENQTDKAKNKEPVKKLKSGSRQRTRKQLR